MNQQFNKSDIQRNAFQLTGPLSKKGYDWWYHSFTAHNAETGEAKSFFVEYFLCNPALGGSKPVFGQLPKNKAESKRPSYLMVKAGTWGKDAVQLHKFFSWKDSTVLREAPYSIGVPGCTAGEKFITGRIEVIPEEVAEHPEYMCGSGSMSWNLKVVKKVAFNVGYGAGKIFRRLNAFEMYWHAEGMKSEYSGTVIFNGVTYIVDPKTSYGYADKNWGSNFTSPWVWLSSCNLTSLVSGKKLNDTVFDVGGGRPKVFGLPLNRKLLSAMWYEGKEYEFNFSKFWTHTRTKFECNETDDEVIWQVKQESKNAAIEYEVTCKKNEMLLINYESPDGMRRHNRLWNGGTGVGTIKLYSKVSGRFVPLDTMKAENIGCEFGEYGK